MSAILLAAALVGTLAGVDGAVIELHSDNGVCVADARRAVFAHKSGNIGGCWKVVAQSVVLVFFDGDYALAPLSSVKLPTGS